MDFVALGIGWGATWAFGVALLAALRDRSTATSLRGEVAWTLGCGWFIGQFLLTLWMRLLAAFAVPFGIPAIGGPMLALALLVASLARYGRRNTLRHVASEAIKDLSGVRLPRGYRIVWLALLGWLTLRFALLLTEVVRRPLYPWDAWTQWATKARVWFELRTMAPFVTASEWLHSASSHVYFDAAPQYPATVPLTQVWSATLLGRWDDALVNFPWWLTGVAFGLAVYGFLAQRGAGALVALLGTWLVLSLPILETHIALAGYADLAMASYFTVATLASLRWIRTRYFPDAGVALLLLAACCLIKNPGRIWVLTLLPGLAIALMPRNGLRIAAACFAVAAIVVAILARSGVTLLGYHLQLDFDMPWAGLLEAYFTFANWHLLWYGVIVVMVLARRELMSRDLAPLTVTIAAGLSFLMFGFAFTNARAWVEDQSTVNRATLHLAPLVVIWLVLLFRAWEDRSSSAVTVPGAEPVAP